jgi:FkbM family methyltransferase
MPTAEEYSHWYLTGIDEKRGVGEFFEQIIEMIYEETLAASDFALDGGANRGRHTLPMADRVGPDGLIVGVEAIPGLAAALAGRIRTEGRANVSILGEALGPSEGATPFVHVQGDDGYSGRLERDGIPGPARATVQTITVPMTTIDAIVRKSGRGNLRFIKLDLEGGEYDALRGASDTMRDSAPLIVFENGRSSAAAVYHYEMEQWFELFASSHYRISDLFGRPFTPAHWHAAEIPYYFVAARRDCDAGFVADHLADRIAGICAKAAG